MQTCGYCYCRISSAPERHVISSRGNHQPAVPFVKVVRSPAKRSFLFLEVPQGLSTVCRASDCCGSHSESLGCGACMQRRGSCRCYEAIAVVSAKLVSEERWVRRYLAPTGARVFLLL